jgi:anti-anti-sigma factor
MQISLQSIDEGGILRIQTEGEIRLGDQLRTQDPMLSLLGSDWQEKKVLVSLEKSSYIDSSGVAWLVKTHKLCRSAGGILVIHSIPPSIMSILKLLRMEQVLNLVEDEEAARTLALGVQNP